MRTIVKPLTRERVNHVVQIALRHYEYPPEFGPQISMTDEYGWADEKSPIIMWEEGPYNFGYEFTQNEEARAYLAEAGFYMEAATSWAIVIYPSEGEINQPSSARRFGWCGNTRHVSEAHEEQVTCFAFIEDNDEV